MLPAVTGITLIYGILRKELALEMLLVLAGASSLAGFMTPLQIFLFSLLITLYFPCIGTFAALKREFGWKQSTVVALGSMVLAIVVTGIVGRIFIALGILI
jgi:ferrous iron transport protein B